MKVVLFLLLTQISVFSQWKEIESPNGRISAHYYLYNNDFELLMNNTEIFQTEDNWNNFVAVESNFLDSIGYINDIFFYDNLIYLSTIYDISNKIGGGVYYSSDKGLNWHILSDTMKNKYYYAFKKNGDFTYSLTKDGLNLYNSENNQNKLISKYYDPKLKDSIKIRGNNIYFNESNNIIIINSFTNSLPGLLISTDNGNSFSEIFLLNDYRDIINKVFWKSDTIFVASSKGIFISYDLGQNWKPIINKNGDNFITDIVYLNSNLFASSDKGNVYKIVLNSEEWEMVFNSNSIKSIRLYDYQDELFFTSTHGLYKYNESSNSFSEKEIFIKSTNYSLQTEKDSLYLVTTNSGIPKTISGDNFNWKQLNDSLFIDGFNIDNFSKSDSLILCSYFSFSGVIISKDYGKTWTYKLLPTNSSGIKTYVTNSHIYQNKFFITTIDGRLLISKNMGNTWLESKYDSKYSETFTNIFMFDGMYFGTTKSNGILISTDDGDTWKKINSDTTDLMEKQYVRLLAKNKNNLLADSKDLNLIKSSDNGKSWNKTFFSKENISILKIANYRSNFFILTDNGFYFSTDNGNTFKLYNNGIEKEDFQEMKDVIVFGSNLVLCFNRGIYTLPLSELGIEYTTVEKTEKRNYLYTFPPFPQPTKQEVKISTYWDSALPFTVDDVEIYNLAGIKINTTNKLSINKETNYNGHIIWDTSSEQAGIYIVNIKHGTESRTQKVMVVD
jgi:photosystem II stability/assembly factor-like uncharacterized protein